MSQIFLKYREDDPDSNWIEVPLDVDAIRIEANNATFEITPTKGRLGAFTIKSTQSVGSVNFIARNENFEVHFSSPEGVDVY
jgi:hypothetical protein